MLVFNIVWKNELTKSLCDDAVELYVIGKDLDFLYEKDYKKQTDRIEHLKIIVRYCVNQQQMKNW